MANQVTENLFNAMDEIINARLQNLNYDTTIKAIVVNNNQAERGIYEVSEIGAENTNVFIAHSDNVNYQKNDCVYVTIPRGDTAAENKIIIGKYVEDGDAYYNYVNPMDSFLEVSGNLIQTLPRNQWEITANNPADGEIEIWSAHNLSLRGFDRLALKGQFKTWLQTVDTDIVSGNYGLRLRVETSKGEIFFYELSTKEMFGNPYNYETYYAQNILLNISNIEEIRGMRLVLFQNNDFYLSDGTIVPCENVQPNIFMKVPYISVGYDVSNFDGDDLRIYTQDEQSYDCREESIKKTIRAKWIHVAEGTSAIVADDPSEMPRNPDYQSESNSKYPQPRERADLTWYVYDKHSHGTIITGRNWQKIPEAQNQFTYTFNTDTSVESNTVPNMRFRAVIEMPSVRYINAQFARSSSYTSIINKAEQSSSYIECISILYDIMDGALTSAEGQKKIAEIYTNNLANFGSEDYGNIIKALNEYLTLRGEISYILSGELTFPNLGYDPAKYSKDNIAELQVIVDPGGMKGQYLIYDDTGIITNASESQQIRYCEAQYKTLAGVATSINDIVEYHIDDTELISWYIPLDSTMIIAPEKGIEYSNYDTVKTITVTDTNNAEGLPLGRYFQIERTPQKDNTKLEENTMLFEHHMYSRQQFRIKDYYTQMETNNQIYCRVTKRGRFYMGVGSMFFGIAGTNGTDATFILRLYETDDDGVSISETGTPASALSVTTTRYSEDLEGNLVNLITTRGRLVIVPELYDYNNHLVEGYFRDHPVTYRIYGNYSQPFVIENYPTGESKKWLGWSYDLEEDELDNPNNDFYCVIEAEVPYQIIYNYATYTQADLDAEPALRDVGKKVGDYKLDAEGNKQIIGEPREDKLKTYLPVSIIKNKLLKRTQKISNPRTQISGQKPNLRDYYRQVIGANRVIYDRNGSNAQYYKDPYQLLNSLLEEVPNIEWCARIRASDGKSGAERDSIESFYPSVSPSWKLIPLEMYILGNSISENFCVYGKKNFGTASNPDWKTLCVQPVLIMQNKYGSSMLNKWDGGLTIDEKNGTILASMIGAGVKDINNTFSGVLMGEVSQAYKDNHNGLGLYGFHQSDQSFGFNIDGTAFIGKAGHGRIWFDGNHGSITSGAYSDGIDLKYRNPGEPTPRPQQGMEIDLDGSDGISSSIKAFGSSGGFVLDTKGTPFNKYVPRRFQEDTGQSSVIENEPIPVTFKVFTGKYGTKIYDVANENNLFPSLDSYERGMIYFDQDGQYIQSTNYNGRYNPERLVGDQKPYQFACYPAGLELHKTPPGWVDLSPSATLEDINNATDNGDIPATMGTFIDLRNGWIDTRKGIVGGWRIGQSFLSSMKNEIILSSDNSGTNVPYIKIGTMKNGVMSGSLWIADYRILGETDNVKIKLYGLSPDVLNLSNAGYIGKSNINNNGEEEPDSNLNDPSKYIQTLSYATTKLTEEDINISTLASWYLYDDTVNSNNLQLGAILQTAAINASENVLITQQKDGIVLWCPQWTSSLTETSSSSSYSPADDRLLSSLGTRQRPWGNAFIANGIFQYETITPYGSSTSETGGWHLVATQDWISKVVVSVINQRIHDVNNLAQNALNTARSGLKKATNAISSILNWCGLFDNKNFVYEIAFKPYNDAAAIYYKYYTITATRDAYGNLTGSINIDESFDNTSAIWGPTLKTGRTATLHDLAGGQSIVSGTSIGDSIVKVCAGINALAAVVDTLKTAYEAHTHQYQDTTYTISTAGTTSVATSSDGDPSHSHTIDRRNNQTITGTSNTKNSSRPNVAST